MPELHGDSNMGWAVWGASSGGTGVVGTAEGWFGVGSYGQSTNSYGVWGKSNSGTGVFGTSQSNSSPGVLGDSPGIGVVGTSNNNSGVRGYCGSSVIPSAPGVRGESPNGIGVYGESTLRQGVFGYSRTDVGVIGTADGPGGIGVVGIALTGRAGGFDGDVEVVGDLTVTSGNKSFKIDHPLDPQNKYLLHHSVESSERMNVYDGVAHLDADGSAWVELPEWFEALNGNLRYQLTAIGGAAPELHVAEELYQHRFRIAGGQGGMKVCWQVTGTRKDPWAAANPFQVEQEKPQQERGRYLRPELYGAPHEQRVMTVAEKAQRERQTMSQAEPPQKPPGVPAEMPQQVPPPRQPPPVPPPMMPPGFEAPGFGRLQEEHRRQIEELRGQIEELRQRL